jgi:hypothetical protein
VNETFVMSTTDWNTVTSDLQRAANNLAWFVLESMTIPGQPPSFLSTMAIPTAVVTLPKESAAAGAATADQVPVQHEQPGAKRKRVVMVKHPKVSKQSSIGHAVDRLVSETLL